MSVLPFSTPVQRHPETGTLASIASKSENTNRAERLRQFQRIRISPAQLLFAGILLVIVIGAILAPVVAPYDPEHNDLLARLAPPAWQDGGTSAHLLGTDPLGRDVLSRLIHGARVSLQVAVVGTLLGAFLGATCGLLTGFRRGILDEALMLVVDAWMALPFIIIALSVIAMLGSSRFVIVLLAMLSGFAAYTRVTRGLALQVSQMQYVQAARALGASRARILLRHALPSILAPLIVLATMEMTGIVLLEASLSFLGLGIQPPTPAWGLMVNEGRDYLYSSWWVGMLPGIAIMLLSTSISMTGDWLRDVLDPTTRT